MQQPVVPELAHNDSRLIHWLATATGLAAVFALSSALQPGPATAAQAADPKSAPAPVPTTAPATTGVDFPLDCGPVKAVVVKKASGDLDGDGRPETVAVVHCDAGMGTPPDGVYVLTQGAKDTAPRVVATLVAPKSRENITELAVGDETVRATILGYSSTDVPSCCPDVKGTAQWQYKDGTFVRTDSSDARSV
ncbi:hypothetical protein ACIQU5_21355 [Streptomyces sp. NPDC090306]|uniref:hypothetical protein n=1 Tax=unclassified Streptomyces TaxID=2593676 RepID=UPI0036E4534C